MKDIFFLYLCEEPAISIQISLLFMMVLRSPGNPNRTLFQLHSDYISNHTRVLLIPTPRALVIELFLCNNILYCLYHMVCSSDTAFQASILLCDNDIYLYKMCVNVLATRGKLLDMALQVDECRNVLYWNIKPSCQAKMEPLVGDTSFTNYFGPTFENRKY